MRPQLLHLDGPHRGKTVTYEKQRLLFGTAPGADIRYTGGLTIQSRHAELTFDAEGCAFHLRALEGEVFVNHREVEEVVLEQNDLIEMGRLGPKLRFRMHAAAGRACKPVSEMMRDAREVGAASGVYGFTRSMRRDLVRHSTRRLRLLVALALLAVVVGYASGWLGLRQTTEQHEAQAREIARLQEELAALRAQNVSRTEIDRLREELRRHTSVVDELLLRDSALKQVLDVYAGGVCLLHGIFTLNTKQGGRLTPLRGSDGKPLELEYVGSGFLASKDGHVITNRHVAEPWWRNRRVEPLLKQGFLPRFTRLDACFPGRMPIAVNPATIRVSREGMDVAVLKVDVKQVPPLPLYAGPVETHRGQRVILLGYPTGMNALMARAERETVTEILGAARNMTQMIAELARRKAILPVITQGALNEAMPRRLVYDADTTSGGSGGPVFGPNGTVIGINFAVTRDFTGSNFGVPISFAKKLLP